MTSTRPVPTARRALSPWRSHIAFRRVASETADATHSVGLARRSVAPEAFWGGVVVLPTSAVRACQRGSDLDQESGHTITSQLSPLSCSSLSNLAEWESTTIREAVASYRRGRRARPGEQCRPGERASSNSMPTEPTEPRSPDVPLSSRARRLVS